MSIRDRTALAASVVNALGIDVNNTNISVTSAWNRAKIERKKISKSVKENFRCPEKISIHWDGKTLKMKGNLKSNRVCVYVSGADGENVRKLLGVPETTAGTGKAEADVVKEVLVDWDIKDQIVSIVFDTTASNSSGEVGACYHLEMYVGTPILWTACRHHIYELHIKKVTEKVFGVTKEPGVDIFRRLKATWNQLEIDYDSLVFFDYNSVPEWIAEEARSVLKWGEAELEKGTWPRADYQEFLMLVVASLGGDLTNFKFRLPGADHHARWMSKGIYIIKIYMLFRVFELTKEEEENIRRIYVFTVVFYAKAWFLSPLSTSAARNDLTFHCNVLRYREIEPTVAFGVLQSIRRHQWYTTGQLVVLALTDSGLDVEEKEEMAKILHSLPRLPIQMGRPAFPVLDWSGEVVARPRLGSLVTKDSWLVFDLLGLQGSQDWLQLPCHLWSVFKDYQKLSEFSNNLSVTNDLAERGISMITEFVNKVENEVQRQDLLQTVEFHRALVPNLKKETLPNC